MTVGNWQVSVTVDAIYYDGSSTGATIRTN